MFRSKQRHTNTENCFSALSYEDIIKAFNNPSNINRNEAMAAKIRREIDLRLGGVFSHFQTLKMKKYIEEKREEVLSYGPCQLPTLGFVVHSFLKAQKYNNYPEKCWKIDVHIKKGDKSLQIKWNRKHLFCKVSCFGQFASMFDFPSAIVTDIQITESEVTKPQPLTTATHLINCCKYLKLKASRAMAITENLYNNGFISYPRTETDSFPDNFNFVDILTNLTIDREVGGMAYEVLNSLQKPLKGNCTDNAHTPIYPIVCPSEFNSKEEKDVFYLICRHFFAVLSSNCLVTTKTTEFDVGGELFHYKSKTIKQIGFMKYFDYFKIKEKSDIDFSMNENIEVESIKMVNTSYKKPELLSEYELIDKMNKKKIGTDATFHQHISKLVERKYIKIDGNGKILPTAVGAALVAAYEKLRIGFARPQLMADLEQSLREISEGKRKSDDVLKDFIRRYMEIFEKIYINADSLCIEFSKAIKKFSEDIELNSQEKTPENTQETIEMDDEVSLTTDTRADDINVDRKSCIIS
ncbi:DNA topoisomerase family protein [Trichomonas vaginalis G3]|uniref:DNA topoisomerase n=1 Tax=Trichomonas vaginalis (strain ATCC PRA-98 / G3) TaxID=412133 RepID=A2FIV5_TRIV3|nr:DNA topoisomerase type I protein [Trichomonas vaginalis G3]EAX95170.1 DNA topoisomerase family protein [Trichomonas vaginalis G3]KAI5514508.1 DNA topoisomerase type I protein [Trichomonas vaginalis G3]|eukprot:XP_001308100.1 DNA topoisomerase family protein [Trichomonas vaginalis G3]